MLTFLQLQLGYRSDYNPRNLLSRTLRQNRFQLNSQLQRFVLSVNRIWTRPRVLLVTEPNGKYHQTAEIKIRPPSKTRPSLLRSKLEGALELFSVRFLWGLAISQDMDYSLAKDTENLLFVALVGIRQWIKYRWHECATLKFDSSVFSGRAAQNQRSRC